MKIIALSGSLSSTSINEQLVQYIQKTYALNELELIDNKSLEIPTYSTDLESNEGIPVSIKSLSEVIISAEILLIVTPEHNGNMSAYLKSMLDWLSRENRDFMKDKPVFIVGTSTGRSGAAESIENVRKFVVRLGGNFIDQFSLPSFGHVFENGVLIKEHADKLDLFVEKIKLI